MLEHQDLSAVQAAAHRAVRAGLGSSYTVTAIERWGGGAHNTGYKLLLNDETRLFMKIEKDNIFPRTRRCQIEREVYGIQLAKEAGIDVPVVVGFDFTGRTAGCRYLLAEFIDRDLLAQALEHLTEEQAAPLLAEFEQIAARVYPVRSEVFGELYPGGWLGQYDSWREMQTALSAILLDDAETLGDYSASELADIRAVHDLALDAILSEGSAILTHNDLHIYNVFVEPDHGSLRVGKLFDFGLSLFQAEYMSCSGPKGFAGQEAEIARRFNVTESELCCHTLINDLEFVNFAGAIRFAPDKPYGCLARRKNYLASCRQFLSTTEPR